MLLPLLSRMGGRSQSNQWSVLLEVLHLKWRGCNHGVLSIVIVDLVILIAVILLVRCMRVLSELLLAVGGLLL